MRSGQPQPSLPLLANLGDDAVRTNHLSAGLRSDNNRRWRRRWCWCSYCTRYDYSPCGPSSDPCNANWSQRPADPSLGLREQVADTRGTRISAPAYAAHEYSRTYDEGCPFSKVDHRSSPVLAGVEGGSSPMFLSSEKATCLAPGCGLYAKAAPSAAAPLFHS